MRSAIIIGAGGQDGTLLHEQLLREETTVLALGRNDTDFSDFEAALSLLKNHPDEIYYLAAHHHSSDDASGAEDLELYRNSVAVHMDNFACLLNAIRTASIKTRIFYAGSSLVFGESTSPIQNEQSPFAPRCIYSITKAAGLNLCRHYRNTHGIFAVGGILFNHESVLRPAKYVIPKIIDAAIAISRGNRQHLKLGNLQARVDWGYAPDFVDAMVRMIRLRTADDFVVATGKTHSVRDVVEFVFESLDLDWRPHIVESPEILIHKRNALCGDSTKLQMATDWSPTICFQDMLTLLLNYKLNG